MLRINKYIFYEICDKNFEIYLDLITTAKEDYNNIIKEFKNIKECHEVRKLAHKLLGIISILDGTNIEILYIVKSMLFIDKSCLDLHLYKNYIDMLYELKTEHIF